MGRKCIDLTGKTFGILTVLERVKSDKYSNAQWLCQCSCENKTQKIISSNNLLNESTKSCGCIKKEKIAQFNTETKKKYNTYDLSGEYGIGYTFKNEPFYFDLEDYDLIKDYCWYLDKKNYVITISNDKYINMHRLVTNCPSDMDIDHRDHIHWDNRKSELRIVTTSQNCMNRSLHSNNTSGTTGVYWHKNNEKWVVQININGKQTNLGYYDDFDEAVNVRKKAELKYYGDYRYKTKVGD